MNVSVDEHDFWVFWCAGIGEDDLRACTWRRYGGETLSPDTCIAFDPAEEMILALSPS